MPLQTLSANLHGVMEMRGVVGEVGLDGVMEIRGVVGGGRAGHKAERSFARLVWTWVIFLTIWAERQILLVNINELNNQCSEQQILLIKVNELNNQCSEQQILLIKVNELNNQSPSVCELLVKIVNKFYSSMFCSWLGEDHRSNTMHT
jgi:hypothetical protein